MRGTHHVAGSVDRGREAAGWSRVVPLCLAVLLASCTSARQQVEQFPPISCSVAAADGTEETVSVTVDGAPARMQSRSFVFEVTYGSLSEGRELVTVVEDADGRVLERVTYLVPGRSRLSNQFGSADEAAVTGVHEVAGDDGRVLRWSCGVQRE